MPDSVDHNLVARARAGDREAYTALVKAHYKQVFLTCLGVLGRAADAEDVAQEVFLKAATEIRRLRNDARFGAWITRVARHESINLLRRQQRMKEYADKILNTSLGREATHSIEMQRAIERLPQDLREPLVMYYFDGQDVKKVAACLKISASNVYQRLRMAHKQLHGLLIKQGDVS